ncbi:MAG: hypothetical protein AAF492_23055, partial [Verrucomicrobiota bacterium]
MLRPVFMLVLLATAARSELPPEGARLEVTYTQHLEEITATYDKESSAILGKYAKALSDIKTYYADKGDLEGVLKLKERIKAFETDRKIPTALSAATDPLSRAQRTYGAQREKAGKKLNSSKLKLMTGYQRSLKSLVKKLTVAERLDDAVEVRKILTGVEEGMASLAPSSPPPSIRPAAQPTPEMTALVESADIHYTFDQPIDDGRITDDSGNRESARAFNVTLAPGGRSGNACLFEQKDACLRLPRAKVVGKPFTFAAWVKTR